VGQVIQFIVPRQVYFCSYKTVYKIVQGYLRKCLYLQILDLEETRYGEQDTVW